MNFIRNILLFVLFAIITAGCGGGNTTIAANNADSNTGSNSTNSTTTVSNSGSNSGSTSSTSTGSAVLHWSAPTTRADNTAISLSDISSYRLYYGPSATDTPNYININDGTATQYAVTLPAGTYYFRITAIDTTGYEGLKSTALKITL